MILYKYVSNEGGLRILESGAIGFRQASHFSDPFEITAAYPNPASGDALLDFFDRIQFGAKEQMLIDSHAILSLTRAPDNPLMWAHYGDAHRGWVIGFDVDDELFTNHARSTVPVQYGSVLYTKVKPTGAFMDLASVKTPFRPSGQISFLPEHFERLQRAFLYKAADWAYEEEVRVVKCCNGIESGEFMDHDAGTFRRIEAGGPLFLLKLPPHCITSACAGVRNDYLAKGGASTLRGWVPDLRTQQARIDDVSWSIRIAETP